MIFTNIETKGQSIGVEKCFEESIRIRHDVIDSVLQQHSSNRSTSAHLIVEEEENIFITPSSTITPTSTTTIITNNIPSDYRLCPSIHKFDDSHEKSSVLSSYPQHIPLNLSDASFVDSNSAKDEEIANNQQLIFTDNFLVDKPLLPVFNRDTKSMFGSLTRLAGDAIKGAKQAKEQITQHASSSSDTHLLSKVN